MFLSWHDAIEVKIAGSSRPLPRPPTHVSALERDERSERLGEEAGMRETEAAVHAVGRDLERLLPDIELGPLLGAQVRRFHQGLHLPPRFDQLADLRGENARREGRVGQLGQVRFNGDVGLNRKSDNVIQIQGGV